ncbi:ribosomal RNA small subunit methyltransferase E [Reticulibacter mediterranei]|uniref:Ribosomal RNA small subunit methyltransferase E n=1 Tax=Reticulibacter mediterranei TaxID=2778369 RepID=A0A8J3IGQ2_9CHLR|nr:16S rRNA (uracil(1498)-N(3))-methyltransferase [Reticulibacter mediterranei]GHO94271.1 ribosomal RNA small subunit methyltransferase E [Reticulibacter mediterranei]
MHRFFIPPSHSLQPSETLTLPDKLAHQVRDVLRLAIGEALILLDNSGDEIICSVMKSSRAGVEVTIQERRAGQRESAVQIILCQGLLKSARFELILEKGTELGVTAFVPTLCRRSMAGLEDAGPSKLQRWQRILQEATEQCGRSRVPTLSPIRPLMHTLNDIPSDALALMPWEEEHGVNLRTTLQEQSPKPQTIVLFIGPEGGLMAEEVALAKRHGVQSVSLGPRILRAETAAIAAIANVMYELEA